MMEDRVDWLKSNVKEISTKHDPYGQHREPRDIIDHFASADPTPKKAYTQWAVNRYHRGDFRQEDHPRLATALSNFDRYKGRLEKKDINQYKRLSDVEDAIHPHLGTAASGKEEKRQIKDEGADLVHSEPGLTVHAMKTHAAACQYGAGTKWCTAGHDPHFFNRYSNDGPLYVVQGKGRKYQFHFPSNQFMDEKDHSVNPGALVAEHPGLKNVSAFKGKHMAFDTDEELNRNIAAGKTYGSLEHSQFRRVDDLKRFLAADATGRLTPDTIEKAHRLHGSNIEPEVFQHPSASPRIRKVGVEKNHFDSVLKNPSTTGDEIRDMRSKVAGGKTLGLIAKHPKTPPDVLHDIAHGWEKHMEASDHALNNPNTPADAFRSLHGKGLEIDAAMSMSKRTPRDVLEKLTSHPNSFVASEARENLANNPEKKELER